MILPEGLRQVGHKEHGLGRAVEPSFFPRAGGFFPEFVRRLGHPTRTVSDDRPTRDIVGGPDDRRLGDRLVVDKRRLDLGGGDAVTRHVHDVVDTTEQPQVTVGIDSAPSPAKYRPSYSDQ